MRRDGRGVMEYPKPVPKYYDQECAWAYSETVYPTLAKKYPNRWIAIAHHRVIASGTKMMDVLTQARRKVARREIPLVFVERGYHVYLSDGRHP